MLYPIRAEANRVVDDIVMSGSDGTIFHRLTHDKEIIPGIVEHMSIDYSLFSEEKEHSKPSIWHDTDGQKPVVQSFLYIYKPTELWGNDGESKSIKGGTTTETSNNAGFL